MIKNYLKIAFRNLLKNKSHSLINITGLSIGITCCLLIALYVKHELSYDKFQEKGDRTARVIMEYSMGGSANIGNYTSTKVGPSFKRNFPEVENFVRIAGSQKIVKYSDKTFVEDRFVYADSTFFSMFSFPLVQGNLKNILSGPNKVVLTESMARKYFDKQDPMGQTIKVSSSETDYVVTGVVRDCPKNSHIKFDFVASFSSLGAIQEETYWNANYMTYLLLKSPEQIAGLQQKIPAFMKGEMKGQLSGNDYLTYELEPFYKIHLHSPHSGLEANGNIVYVYVMGAVALLILVIACFTFINLCTAKSVERAKEIGVRKVAGAGKKQIFWQFIGESALLTFLSAVASYLFAIAALPYFNDLINRNLLPEDLASPVLLLVMVLLLICISFFAGAYPAVILSTFQPVKVLKGMFKNTGHGLVLRKSLFVFQFVISIFLVVCAFVVQKQLYYFQNKKLGFDKERVIILPTDQKVIDKFNTLKSELKKNPAVQYVSKSDFKPCGIVGGYSMSKEGMPIGKAYSVFAGSIDNEYLDACGIHILAGKNITPQDILDANNETEDKNYFHFIINESAAKQLGWTTQEAVGKKMYLDASRPGEVKAVVADFHFSSLHNPIKPLVLFPSNYGYTILVKLSGGAIDKTLADIRKTWKETMPHRPFEYNFLDEDYDALYTNEKNLGKAMTIFTLLSVLLASLGLFGLSSYAIQQRAKEIGILKVLGAPVFSIVKRLSSNFIWLVIVAIFISFPIAGWAMSKWLQDFSYRIDMNAWLFIIPGCSAILVAFLTVGLKALQAAVANPIKNLRTE